jgi:hypothetical protein
MVVLGMQPLARLVVVAADQRIEGAINSQKQQRQLTLF